MVGGLIVRFASAGSLFPPRIKIDADTSNSFLVGNMSQSCLKAVTGMFELVPGSDTRGDPMYRKIGRRVGYLLVLRETATSRPGDWWEKTVGTKEWMKDDSERFDWLEEHMRNQSGWFLVPVKGYTPPGGGPPRELLHVTAIGAAASRWMYPGDRTGLPQYSECVTATAMGATGCFNQDLFEELGEIICGAYSGTGTGKHADTHPTPHITDIHTHKHAHRHTHRHTHTHTHTHHSTYHRQKGQDDRFSRCGASPCLQARYACL